MYEMKFEFNWPFLLLRSTLHFYFVLAQLVREEHQGKLGRVSLALMVLVWETHTECSSPLLYGMALIPSWRACIPPPCYGRGDLG